MKHHQQMDPTSNKTYTKNPSKIVKNDAQERSGGDLGKGSVPGQLQEQARDDFWSLLAPLGRFWVILGTP